MAKGKKPDFEQSLAELEALVDRTRGWRSQFRTVINQF